MFSAFSVCASTQFFFFYPQIKLRYRLYHARAEGHGFLSVQRGEARCGEVRRGEEKWGPLTQMTQVMGKMLFNLKLVLKAMLPKKLYQQTAMTRALLSYKVRIQCTDWIIKCTNLSIISWGFRPWCSSCRMIFVTTKPSRGLKETFLSCGHHAKQQTCLCELIWESY